MERGEDERVRERHGRQEQGDVPGDVGDEERALDQALAAGLTAQVLEAGDLEGQAFEEGEGKKSHAWWRVSRPRKPVSAAACSLVKTRTSAATSGSLSMWLGLA